MNGDPPSDRPARLDDRGGTVADSLAATRADDRHPTGSGEPGRVEGGDPDEPEVTLCDLE